MKGSPEPSGHVAGHSGMRPSRAGEIALLSAATASPRLARFLLAVSLVGLSASWPDKCQEEPTGLLSNMIQRLGNSSGRGALYTPQDITVCYADNLKCFHLELKVMQEEQDEPLKDLSWLINYMDKLEKKLQAEGWSQHCPTCWPCESHPQRPTLIFLNKLMSLFQFSCITAGTPKRRDCPSPAP